MSDAVVKRIPIAWSISSLDLFVQCPHKFYRLKVLKDVKDKPFDAADWGNRFHKMAERYLKAKGGLLPVEFDAWKEYFDYLLRAEGDQFVEHDLALTLNLQPCGFFASDVWVRGKNDFMVINGDKACIVDHKTNAKRKDYTRQGILLSLFVFYLFPNVNETKVCFCFTSEKGDQTTVDWLKQQFKQLDTYRRDQIPDMWKEFLQDLKDYKRAFDTDTWPCRSSGLCKGYCPVSDCEHYGELPAHKKK